MLLSSGVVWRHHTPGGVPRGVPGWATAACSAGSSRSSTTRSTGWSRSASSRDAARPATRSRSGRRYDTRALTDVLVRAAGDVRLEEPFREAGILATGGFGARLARERGLLLRANEWSEGDGLDYGVARGAGLTAGLDEFYGRALPGEVDGERVRVGRAAVRAPRARARRRGPRPRRGGLARERSRPAASRRSGLVRRRRAGAAAARARANGGRPGRRRASRGRRRAGRRRSFRSRCPLSPKLVEPPFVAVRVYAAVTHTIGGLRIDEQARVLDGDGRPVAGPAARRAPTRAASSPAATAADSPQRSSSAASPPRPLVLVSTC